jgi:hypothetical protein
MLTRDPCVVITMLAITYLAEIVQELTFISMSGQIWALPFLVYLSVVNTAGVNRWVLYTVITLLLAYPNCTFPLRRDPCAGANWHV